MGEDGMVYQDEDGNMYHADDMMEGDEYGMEDDGHHMDDYGMEGSPEVRNDTMPNYLYSKK